MQKPEGLTAEQSSVLAAAFIGKQLVSYSVKAEPFSKSDSSFVNVEFGDGTTMKLHRADFVKCFFPEQSQEPPSYPLNGIKSQSTETKPSP
jgi:hypothetical protein